MTKKLSLLSIFLCCILNHVNSQAPDWSWARSACSLSAATSITAITTDLSGNIFIAGNFRDSAEFGGFVYHPTGTMNLFLAKYDSAGNFLWIAQARGANSPPYDLITAICSDSSGNCYATGFFNGMAVFAHDTIISSGSSPDVFVVKINPSGNVSWLKKGSGQGSDYGYGIGLDDAGYCYVSGSFEQSISFGANTLTATNGSTDIFIVRIDASGNFVSAHNAGGTGTDLASAMAVDRNGNCFVTGMFNSPQIALGSDTITFSNTGFDAYVAKFDSSGNAIWGHVASGPANQEPSGVATDQNGNCYITGIFKGDTMYIDTTTLVTYGYYDFFTAKYDSTGNMLWAGHQGSATFGTEFSTAIATDTSGNFYTTGQFRNPATFAPFNVTSPSALSIFVTQFDSTGNAAWVQQSGSASSSLSSTAMHIDDSGNIFITGSYEQSTTFGNDSLIVAPGYTAGYYIAKLANENTTGIHTNNDGARSLNIFPNPAQDKIYISGINSSATIRMYNITGAEIYERTSTGNQSVDLKNIPSGIYLLEIISGGSVERKKFIKL